MDSFPVSSHLNVVENWLSSPLVSDSYCSAAAHKSAGLGCLLKGGSGSKVGEPCPLAPSHQMAPQGFSGCQQHSLSLSLSHSPFTSHHPTSLPDSTCVVTPCLPHSHFFFLPDNSTHFPLSPLGPRPTGLHPSSSSLLSAAITLLLWW